MGLEILKSNLMQSRKIIEELIMLNNQADYAKNSAEREFFNSAVNALLKQLDMINNALPTLLADLTVTKVIAPEKIAVLQVPTGTIVLNKEDRRKFIQELKISEDLLKKLKREKKIKRIISEKAEFKKSSFFVVLASKVFSKYSFRLADSEFKQLNENLRKANMPYLLSTYISIMLFSTFIVFIVSLLIAVFLGFFKIEMVVGDLFPRFSFLGIAGLGLRIAKNILFSISVSVMTFLFLYIYPSTQVASIGRKINSELPFAVIHMSSIAGSGVEPSQIFKILALSTEYPTISKEMRKIVNYVNIYGYDLVNALRNVAKTTSSERLADLLNGFSTNISGGGNLQDYLNKIAEDTLLDYKLERKKYSNIAETSMDIYIGVLIAAPLILMVLLIIMNVTGMNLGMSMQTLSFLIIGAIALINIGFLIFLRLRQPT